MEEKLFSKKIKYLNTKLNLTKKEFTKLFWNGDGKKFTSRHNTVHESWLTKGINQVKGFYFDEYPISKETLDDGKFAFTRDDFMYSSFNEFKERVDIYIEYKEKPKELFEYRYIYYYDSNQKKISHVRINSLAKLSENQYKIEIVLPKIQNIKIQNYIGTVKIIDGYFYISVKNSFEIVNFIFILNRGYRFNDKVHGIQLGRSTLKGLPRANKELLTKEKLTKEEEEIFSLVANESDYLISTEVLEDIFSDKYRTYMNKFYKKIDDLESFSESSSKVLGNEFTIDTSCKKNYKFAQPIAQHLKEKNFSFHRNSFIDYPLQFEESHIIGEKIFYIDNHVESTKVVFMFHGLGLDHNDFREYIEKSNYRCIAPTLYGFNKNENIKDTLSYKTHCYLWTLFLRKKMNEIKPQFVTLVGFSIGGDMIQDIVNQYSFIEQRINSVIILDCNINIHTCTISKKIASLTLDDKRHVLNIINSFNQNIKELKDWLQVQQYLIKVFSKFIDRLDILSFFAIEIIDRFSKDTDNGFECFTFGFKNMTQKINNVQYIFSNDHINKELINKIKFINLHNPILGNDYNEASIQLEKEYLHFDLLEYSNLKQYIEKSFEIKRMKND